MKDNDSEEDFSYNSDESESVQYAKYQCSKVEIPLTKDEKSLDLTNMMKLNLGDPSNYKTKLV